MHEACCWASSKAPCLVYMLQRCYRRRAAPFPLGPMQRTAGGFQRMCQEEYQGPKPDGTRIQNPSQCMPCLRTNNMR